MARYCGVCEPSHVHPFGAELALRVAVAGDSERLGERLMGRENSSEWCGKETTLEELFSRDAREAFSVLLGARARMPRLSSATQLDKAVCWGSEAGTIEKR